MKLYTLTTAGLGDFYVLAKDPTEAEETLLRLLNKSDYGFSSQRRIVNIKWHTDSLEGGLKDKSLPHLSDENARLLIVSDWNQT